LSGDVDYPTFDPKDPFTVLLFRLAEILKDTDYKPHLIDFIKAKTEQLRAESKEIEVVTLTRLDRLNRQVKK
jgi:hypothetical protein